VELGVELCGVVLCIELCGVELVVGLWGCSWVLKYVVWSCMFNVLGSVIF
jgi:hypothetical protein